MKTLIIAGIYENKYQSVENNGGMRYTVHYNVTLYGQSPDKPLMDCIGFIDKELNGFEELQRIARERYCQWFNTDLNNIISMETIYPKTYVK